MDCDNVTEPWRESPLFTDEVLDTMAEILDQDDPPLTRAVGQPLILALGPALINPQATLKGAELAAVTLQRLGHGVSTTLVLIDAVATVLLRHGVEVSSHVLDHQRQRLQVRAADTLTERQRRELRSALSPSHHDPLTGLLNRRGFMEALNASFQRVQRSKTKIGLVLLDIKALELMENNQDPRQHDRFLVALSQRLHSLTRQTDALARLGETTFAVILEGMDDRANIANIVERELQTLTASNKVTSGQSPLWTGGLAIGPDDGDNPLALLDVAEHALMRAGQESGRAGFRVASSSQDLQHEGTSSLRIHALIAQTAKNIEVRYQPIVDLTTGRASQLEALVRLRTPTGVIGPENFIDTLSPQERRNLFESVLDRVAHDLIHSRLARPVAINIEPDLISSEGYAAAIIETWRDHGLPASLLRIEITETQDLFSLAYDPLALLKEAGHPIALDDFGTGYASLSRIISFPFDEIKLDRTFLEPIDLLNQGLPLLTVALDLSELMEIDLVVEGVEDPRLVPALRALGVRYVQGFALARPLPFSAILELPDALAPSTPVPSERIAAAVQTFRWERGVIALAASETNLSNPATDCPLARALVDSDLIELHRTQHQLVDQLLATNDQGTIRELVRLGSELRRRASTRFADH